MIVKNIIAEDFSNYKVCSMFIGFPSCSFKCEQDCGAKFCQNAELVKSPDINIPAFSIVSEYLSNPLSKAIVCGGLEPIDSWKDLQELIIELRMWSQDPVVIYTGYYKEEVLPKVAWLKSMGNIIVKFGRFIPNQEQHFDKVLGVMLASPNQYAEEL